MVRKIVLAGPMEVGKSTLRKWFFEGTPAYQLLENPLEPTMGFETFNYKLFKKLGVFDLAGQELARWFNGEATIFNNSDVIINVLDAASSTEDLLDYIDQALEVQEKKAPDSEIFFLIHKIDLLQESEIKKKKEIIKTYKKGSDFDLKDRIFYTSIKPQYVNKSLKAIIQILKKSKIHKSKTIKTDLIEMNFKFFNYLKKHKNVPMEKMKNKLILENNEFGKLMAEYIKGGLIKEIRNKGNLCLKLTEKGKKYIDKVLNIFTEKSKEIQSDRKQKLSQNYIFGFIISDGNGKTLMNISATGSSLKKTVENESSPDLDLELIPMFINALQHFSNEINVKELKDFNIRGKNLKLTSLKKDKLTMTIFLDPDLQFNIVRQDFDNLFELFIKTYSQDLEDFEKSGNATPFMAFKPVATKNLLMINREYEHYSENYEEFNEQNAQDLYERLDSLDQNNLSDKKRIQIKDMKVKLLEAIVSKNAVRFQKIKKDILEESSLKSSL